MPGRARAKCRGRWLCQLYVKQLCETPDTRHVSLCWTGHVSLLSPAPAWSKQDHKYNGSDYLPVHFGNPRGHHPHQTLCGQEPTLATPTHQPPTPPNHDIGLKTPSVIPFWNRLTKWSSFLQEKVNVFAWFEIFLVKVVCICLYQNMLFVTLIFENTPKLKVAISCQIYPSCIHWSWP